jgi:sterol desaturase/sphingolipid hydroxylase (fatty acid hydroxylase superfamily)
MVALAIVLLFICESLWPLYPRSFKSNLKNTLVNLVVGLFSVGLVEKMYQILSSSANLPSFSWLEIRQFGFAVEFFICVLVLDLVSWCWHWLNHNVPLLWRSHAVHHSDLYLNTSSAIRFHFFELFPGYLIRIAIGQALGFSLPALAAFQAVYMIANAFEHSNLAISSRLDSFLSRVIVTPRLHHLHHSCRLENHRSNLGTIFSFWDRAFGTFRAGSDRVVDYGIERGQKELRLAEIFLLPFRR